MTDSIYHGAAIGLSLYASNPPDFRVSRLDFGRALAYLGRAGWDNENTLESQGERYTTFLRDLELIDDESRLTEIGTQAKAELTLPIHMSLRDLAGQLNPGGARGGRGGGRGRVGCPRGRRRGEPRAGARPPRRRAEPAAAEDEGPGETGEYEEVRGERDRRRPSPPPAAALRRAAAPGRPRAAVGHLGDRRARRDDARLLRDQARAGGRGRGDAPLTAATEPERATPPKPSR